MIVDKTYGCIKREEGEKGLSDVEIVRMIPMKEDDISYQLYRTIKKMTR